MNEISNQIQKIIAKDNEILLEKLCQKYIPKYIQVNEKNYLLMSMIHSEEEMQVFRIYYMGPDMLADVINGWYPTIHEYGPKIDDNTKRYTMRTAILDFLEKLEQVNYKVINND